MDTKYQRDSSRSPIRTYTAASATVHQDTAARADPQQNTHITYISDQHYQQIAQDQMHLESMRNRLDRDKLNYTKSSRSPSPNSRVESNPFRTNDQAFFVDSSNSTTTLIPQSSAVAHLNQRISAVKERISESQAVFTEKFDYIEGQIKSFQDYMVEDKKINEETQELRQEELRVMSEDVDDFFKQEVVSRVKMEDDLMKMINAQFESLNETVEKEKKERDNSCLQLEEELVNGLPNLQGQIEAQQVHRQEAGDVIQTKLTVGVSEVKVSVEQEQKDRELTDQNILELIKKLVSDVRSSIAKEKYDRETSEETMLQLLEQSCNQIAAFRKQEGAGGPGGPIVIHQQSILKLRQSQAEMRSQSLVAEQNSASKQGELAAQIIAPPVGSGTTALHKVGLRLPKNLEEQKSSGRYGASYSPKRADNYSMGQPLTDQALYDLRNVQGSQTQRQPSPRGGGQNPQVQITRPVSAQEMKDEGIHLQEHHQAEQQMEEDSHELV